MTVIPDWRAVLKYAWSVRLLMLAAVLSGAEVALPFLDGLLPVSPGVFALLSFACTVGAFVARFIAQKRLTNTPETDYETGD